jgi:flagellar biosynthesis protein FlhG
LTVRVIEFPHDQASGLRQLAKRRRTRVIAVTSGKGGVGKTNVSVNLAIALAEQGRDVVLMDADLGLGNADVLLGLQPRFNLAHVIAGERTLDEIIVSGPASIRLLPASSGAKSALYLDPAQHGGLVRAFSDSSLACDTMLVDTAAGINDSVLTFSKASQEIVVVVCDEPASITDAYALMKVLHRDHDRHRFRIVVNMARSAREGRELFLKLLHVSGRFLDISLDLMGMIPFDDCVHRAVRRQRAVVEAYPASRVAAAFKEMALATDKWRTPDEASGHLEFFVEKLVESGTRG